MSLSEAGSASPSASPMRRSQISTIGEAFYNALGVGSFVSDDEPSVHSDSSSDAPIPYLSPQKEDTSLPSSNHQHATAEHMGQHDSLLISERSSESKGSVGKRDASNGEDTLLLSERTTGTKDPRDTSNGEDTLMISDRSDFLTRSEKSTGSKVSGERDASHGEDTLMMSGRSDVLLKSERSSARKTSAKRDISQGDDTLMMSDRSDTLIISDRSGGSKPKGGASARSGRSSGSKANKGDILARSERSSASKKFLDSSNRSGASRNFRDTSTGYDSLLMSETTDESWRRVAQFAGDQDDSSISSTPSTPFPHLEELEEEEESNDYSKLSSGELSQRMIEVIENPPLVNRSAPFAPDPLNIEDEDRSLQGQGMEDGGQTSTAKKNPIQISGTTAPTTTTHQENIEYNGSISTNNSIRINERVGKIPRRWIIDRIDGTVRPEEEDASHQWRRKPPLFLCLPSPLVALFPWFFEENPLCLTVGKWGFFGGDTINDNAKSNSGNANGARSRILRNSGIFNAPRKPNSFLRTLVMAHAMLLNACGLFATILAGLALTRSYPSLLESAPFGKTTVIPTLSSPTAESDSPVAGESVTLYLGLLALGIHNPTASDVGMVVVGFRDFCVTSGTEQFLSPEECESCADASVWIVVGYFLATIAYLPTFAVGVSRLYRNYDTNCSKVSAGIWSLVSVTGYAVVLSSYSSCLDSLYDGEVLYTSEGAINDEENVFRDEPGEQFLVAEFDWKMGVGQILFVIGLTLKLFDFVSNCCIATPAITRSRELQWDYEEGPAAENGENGNPQEGPSFAEVEC